MLDRAPPSECDLELARPLPSPAYTRLDCRLSVGLVELRETAAPIQQSGGRTGLLAYRHDERITAPCVSMRYGAAGFVIRHVAVA